MSKFVSLLLGVVLLASCSEKLSDQVIASPGIAMSGAKAVPQKPGAGFGSIDAYYNKSLHTLNYTVKWYSLSSAPATGFGIYGPAAPGFNGALKQAFSGFPASASGSYSGSVLIDGLVLKEEELLLGEYYITIPTTTFSAAAGGEIRGQITFVQ